MGGVRYVLKKATKKIIHITVHEISGHNREERKKKAAQVLAIQKSLAEQATQAALVAKQAAEEATKAAQQAEAATQGAEDAAQELEETIKQATVVILRAKQTTDAGTTQQTTPEGAHSEIEELKKFAKNTEKTAAEMIAKITKEVDELRQKTLHLTTQMIQSKELYEAAKQIADKTKQIAEDPYEDDENVEPLAMQLHNVQLRLKFKKTAGNTPLVASPSFTPSHQSSALNAQHNKTSRVQLSGTSSQPLSPFVMVTHRNVLTPRASKTSSPQLTTQVL